MIVLWLSPPTFHPHLLNASSSLVRVGVWTGFGSHPTAQTTPDLKLMFFLSGYNSQPSSYPDVCGPKYLSKIGSIEALGNSCGSYSFLIWIPLSWSSLKSTETKICCTQYIKIQKYCQCIHRPTCFWLFLFLHVGAHIEVDMVAPVQKVWLELLGFKEGRVGLLLLLDGGGWLESERRKVVDEHDEENHCSKHSQEPNRHWERQMGWIRAELHPHYLERIQFKDCILVEGMYGSPTTSIKIHRWCRHHLLCI